MNILVEAKNEYTIRIISILSPLILEGLNSIYNKAKEISTSDNVLKIFQSFLKRIPKWTEEIIESEVNRIKNNSNNFELLYDLIRAAVKANLRVLIYSPVQSSEPPTIDPDYYQCLDFSNFIHNIYIECAREIWNNPYLFYHCYTPIEIKRNQRDTLDLIKKCIEESIRKSLPLKKVLEIYLGNEAVKCPPDNKFENTITEAEEKNLSLMTKKDLDPSFVPPINNTLSQSQAFIPPQPLLENKPMQVQTLTKQSSSEKKSTKVSEEKSLTNQLGGKESSHRDLDSKILNILNSDKLKLSDEENNLNSTSDSKMKSTKKLSETSSEELISNNMDSNLKKILKNDLANTDTEESTANFKPENNSAKYQEIFSNSNKESINSQERDEQMDKNKFFNNYLNF